MSLMNSPDRYGLIARSLHWTMAVLMVVGYITGEVGEDALEDVVEHGRQATDSLAAGLHTGAGIALVGLLIVRLLWRAADKPLPPPTQASNWEVQAAKWAHRALYGVLALMPLSGLALAMTGPAPLPVVGLSWAGIDSVPPLFTSHFLNEGLEEFHEALVGIMMTVVALHVAATVFHAVIKRDGVAARMVPFVRS